MVKYAYHTISELSAVWFSGQNSHKKAKKKIPGEGNGRPVRSGKIEPSYNPSVELGGGTTSQEPERNLFKIVIQYLTSFSYNQISFKNLFQ